MLEFDTLIEFIRTEVNQNLKKIPIPESPKYLYDPIRYSIHAKGKRFRPIIVHLCGKTNGVDSEVLMKISLAVELLHNFTLVHDDIMDNDILRHGKETIHERWDSSTAILAGDGIYTLAQIILNNLPEKITEISRYFNHTTLEICEGQALDKQFENDVNITEDMYIDMINKKTGALLGASAALPLIYNGATKKIIKTFEQFGRFLGKGFQIHDDLLEITANSHTMGKSLGSDILEGKQTILVIKARNQFPDEWISLLNDTNEFELIKKIKDFFNDSGILEETRLIANKFFNASLELLNELEDVNTKNLAQLVKLIEKRTY